MASDKKGAVGSSGKCPPGLECLLSTSALIIDQKIDFLEQLTGFEEENSYLIYNDKRDTVLWAQESSSFCDRCCIPCIRPLEIRVYDLVNRREVLYIKRPLNLGCCFPGCLQAMVVYTSGGALLGVVEERCVFLGKEFTVKDSFGEVIFYIEGIKFCQCCKVSFEVYTRNRQASVGRITKGWSGFMREMFTDADVFSITFPVDLDVKMKAVLIGAVFLLDLLYFENNSTSCL